MAILLEIVVSGVQGLFKWSIPRLCLIIIIAINIAIKECNFPLKKFESQFQAGLTPVMTYDTSTNPDRLKYERRRIHDASCYSDWLIPRASLWAQPAQGYNPRDFLTVLSAISLNLFLSSRHVFAASTFAALSSLGSANMLTTDSRIFSTL